MIGIKKMIGKVVLSLCMILLSNCANILNTDKQLITVVSIGDKSPEKTRCVLKNEEGLWKVIPMTSAIIHRDGNVLYVQCVNALQTGENYVQYEFNEGALALDLFTLIGVAIDAYKNAFFSYPPFVTVLMKDKKDVEFVEPLLQRGSKPY
jgi:hypothetical protein